MSSNTGEPALGSDSVHRVVSNGEFETPDWWNWPTWNSYSFASFFPKILDPVMDLDTKQCAVWKDEVQNLLILAGLFSAVVTAFVIESYRRLQPDPNDQIIALLSRIADQTNGTIGNASPQSTSFPTTLSFVPSPSNIRVNVYWFISLVLSLTVALIGIIAQQWLREHQLYRKDMNPHQQFAIFSARSDGLQRWYVPQIFAGLPLLLQTALVLFFIGLVEFLFSVQIDVAIPVFAAVAIPIVFLVVTTILPTLQLYAMHFPYLLRVNDRPPAPCPYKSPQSLIFQNVAILSVTVFDLSSRAFSILWAPFVLVARLFARSTKPFYGKSAPFSTDDIDYRCSRDRLRNAARKWASMDIQWLATRTSYAAIIHTPITVQPSQSAYISNTDRIDVIGFYDWVIGIKQVASSSDPTDNQHRDSLALCMRRPIHNLFAETGGWVDQIKASRTDPRLARALHARLAGLLGIINPYGYPQTENLVEVSHGDNLVIHNAFVAVFTDQAWGSELNLHHKAIYVRLITHMKLTRLYLLRNARELFLCSNRPGITPSFLLSARSSLAYHRSILENANKVWMRSVSSLWSETVRGVITDVSEMTPVQPFTHKCTGSSTSRCGSNLHTESIVGLTEYILLFQVRDEIQHTLHLLHETCTSSPNPVQEHPFVLITACAYINAVANVNQDDVDGFNMLLDLICELCGSLDSKLEARPGEMGRHWPGLDSALDYIRNHACAQHAVSAVEVGPSPGLPHNVGAADNV